METMKAIATRKSCRAYTGEQLSDDELRDILKAANAAPVASGKYDEMSLTVIQDRETLSDIDAIVADALGDPTMVMTYGAPTVVVVSAKTAENPEDPVSHSSAGCIVENMALAATDLGLGSVYLYTVAAVLANRTDYHGNLGIPEGFVPVSAVAVGRGVEPLEERELTTSRIKTTHIR